MKIENIVNLKEEMTSLSKTLKSHKSDLDYDFNIMLDKYNPLGTYYWYVRENGTNMMSAHRVFATGDWANTVALYNFGTNVKVYKINLKERKIKNFYGTIKQISLDKFKEQVKKESKEPKKAEVLVLTKDNKTHSITTEFSENMYFKVLNLLKIDSNNVKSSYIIKYIY